MSKLDGRKVDILINNAGFGDFVDFAKADANKIDSMIRLNVLALVNLTHRLLPNMLKAKEAKILNVASVAAFFPGPKMAVYYASKAFVLSFSEALSKELEDTNVTVTVLCPGPTATKFGDTAKASRNNVFKNPAKLAHADQVVAYGIDAMEKGKTIALPGGWMQKLMIKLSRIVPRKTVVNTVAKIQNRKS